jgi:hypothetical protein
MHPLARPAGTSMTIKQECAAIAEAFLTGKLDPLTACRRILELLEEPERAQDPDINVLIGIDSETDHLPDPAHRALWDPAALREKDAETQTYFRSVDRKVREAFEGLAAKWRGV